MKASGEEGELRKGFDLTEAGKSLRSSPYQRFDQIGQILGLWRSWERA